MVFESPEIAKIAYQFGGVNYRAKVKVLAPENDPKYSEFAGKVFETTIGRVLFNGILPDDYPFLNTEINKKRKWLELSMI